MTFGILNLHNLVNTEDEEDFVIYDPNLKEENICSGFMTVSVNSYGDICCVHKPGDSIIEYGLLKKVMKFCVGSVKETAKIFKEFVL